MSEPCKIYPYLSFGGQCETAFKFYERCLGGKITFLGTYGDSPLANEVAPEWRSKVMHATLMVGGQQLAGADAPPERYDPPQGFSVMLGIEKPADAERVFHALAENGTVSMPLQETFWAKRFGVLVDQFGIPWLINCEKGD